MAAGTSGSRLSLPARACRTTNPEHTSKGRVLAVSLTAEESPEPFVWFFRAFMMCFSIQARGLWFLFWLATIRFFLQAAQYLLSIPVIAHSYRSGFLTSLLSWIGVARAFGQTDRGQASDFGSANGSGDEEVIEMR